MESLLSPQVWLTLPKETRQKIADLFSITKSGSVYVVNGPNGSEVQSDGYSYSDLSVITVERMQELTGSTSDNFYALFKKIVLLVNEETLDEVIEVVEEAILENIEKDMEEGMVLDVPEEDFKIATEITKAKFCDTCDSKGRFHKKDCPNKTTHAKA